MITLDTSCVLALLNDGDPSHRRCREALAGERGPLVIPAGILSEVTYMIEHRFGGRGLDPFLADCEAGHYTIDCGEGDFARIRRLVARYADMRLGFADASVVACAERRGGRVMTLDRRHFDVVAGEGRIAIVPDPA